MRIIFVGLHNKPHMTPLDSHTKTGKLVDRIIEKLPEDIEIVKSNILNTEEMAHPDDMLKYAQEWQYTHLPVDDDIIILLGAATQSIYKNNIRHVGRIIRAAHPASKRSHIDMDAYVINVSAKIKSKIH